MADIDTALQLKDILPTLLGVGAGIAGKCLSGWTGYVIFRTKTKEHRKHHDAVHDEIDSRINKLAAGAVEIQDELHEFKRDADRQYVLHDDFQHAVSVLSADV